MFLELTLVVIENYGSKISFNRNIFLSSDRNIVSCVNKALRVICLCSNRVHVLVTTLIKNGGSNHVYYKQLKRRVLYFPITKEHFVPHPTPFCVCFYHHFFAQ